MKGIQVPKSITRNHYALVAIEDDSWEVEADLLSRRYGVIVLPYSPTQEQEEVERFVKN